VDITAGGDFLGLCDQKSSYKHVSDFGRLRSYGHFFNSRTRLRVNRVLRNDLECGEGGVGGYSPGLCILHDRATRAVHNLAATCVAAGGCIFENQLQAQINSN
jgi:hypothetical protein